MTAHAPAMNQAQPAPVVEPASGRAIAALVLGILGVVQVLPIVGSIAAIILGSGERTGPGRAGAILGWIGLALYGFVFLIVAGLMLFGLGFAAVAG